MAPGGGMRAKIGETVFICVYVGKYFKYIFFSRTTGQVKLKLHESV
jgi:hypothetical protein